MNPKKLHPSVSELHESIRQRAIGLVKNTSVADMHQNGWFYWKDLANGDSGKKNSILRALKRNVDEGILESKRICCSHGNSAAETLFFRFLKNDEITRAY